MNATHSDLLRFIRSVKAKEAAGALSDERLLETFVNQRSEASFTALVQRHGAMVFGVCRRLLRQPQDAEDAFQAVFLTLARRAASIRRHESIGSWLHGAALHVAAKMKRTAARRAVHEGRLPPPSPADAMDDITWRELRSALDEELQRLPEQYRAPLVLCYLEARTQDEAARQLGWSKSTFVRRMNQARQLLARRLTRRGLSLSAALTAPLLIDGAAQAAVPPLLVANTVRAGLATVMGNTVNGMVSAQVIALAESGTASLLTKKVSLALMLLASLTLGVGGLLAHRVIQGSTLAEAPVAPPAPLPATSPARSASKEQAIEIKGRVLDPDGKPMAGAKVYLSPHIGKDKSDPKQPSETDAEGRFVCLASRAEVDRGVMLVADAPRYGPDWVSLKEPRDGNELTLRLVKDDVHIKGRVLDLEGRPVAGVTVRIWSVGKMSNEDLTPYLKELQAKPKDRNAASDVVRRYARLVKHTDGILGLRKSIETGDDGRFELRGFGRERIVHLFVEGPGIASSDLTVMTHPEVAKGLPLNIHGPIFDHLAAPGKPIRGTVRDKETGKPLAGIRVALSGVPGGIIYRELDATTNERGQYRIDGGAKQRQYTVTAGGKSYFISMKSNIADTPGLEPLVVDIELERGIEITGRVFNKATGKPLRALISYHARADNPYVKNVSALNRRGPALEDIRTGTYGDDPFTLIGLPGPGYLFVVAFEDDYRKPDLPEDWKSIVPRWRGSRAHPLPVHAWVRIDPSEKDPKSTRYGIALEPVKPIAGQVLDPEGKPLDGYLVVGLTANGIAPPNYLKPHPMSSFQIRGVGPGQSRVLVFIHPEKKIGKVVNVREDQRGPLQIRLESLGAATGRILNADGHPRSGLQVLPALSSQVKDDNLFRAMSDLHRELRQDLPAKTDSDGKFRLDGLMPGLAYMLWVSGSENNSRRRLLIGPAGFTVESGKTKDLGDFKLK